MLEINICCALCLSCLQKKTTFRLSYDLRNFYLVKKTKMSEIKSTQSKGNETSFLLSQWLPSSRVRDPNKILNIMNWVNARQKIFIHLQGSRAAQVFLWTCAKFIHYLLHINWLCLSCLMKLAGRVRSLWRKRKELCDVVIVALHNQVSVLRAVRRTKLLPLTECKWLIDDSIASNYVLIS